MIIFGKSIDNRKIKKFIAKSKIKIFIFIFVILLLTFSL